MSESNVAEPPAEETTVYAPPACNFPNCKRRTLRDMLPMLCPFHYERRRQRRQLIAARHERMRGGA